MFLSDTKYSKTANSYVTKVRPAGQTVKGHEFHWSVLETGPHPDNSLYNVIDQDNQLEGFHINNIWASYIHIHLASDPSLAKRFVEICADKSII